MVVKAATCLAGRLAALGFVCECGEERIKRPSFQEYVVLLAHVHTSNYNRPHLRLPVSTDEDFGGTGVSQIHVPAYALHLPPTTRLPNTMQKVLLACDDPSTHQQRPTDD